MAQVMRQEEVKQDEAFNKHKIQMLWRGKLSRGCAMKFNQNEEWAKQLLETKGIIVKANPKDNFFWCGLALTNASVEDPTQWRGKNVLGEILFEISLQLLK